MVKQRPSVELLKIALEKIEHATNDETQTLAIKLNDVNHIELIAMAACIGVFAVTHSGNPQHAKTILNGLIEMLFEIEAFADVQETRQ
jgi:hypothetical protein